MLWRTISTDRKSTRLNSSHANISYAVFCLKKKISAESDNVLASLEEGQAYVIGGLVDHNREKVPGDCDLCVLD